MHHRDAEDTEKRKMVDGNEITEQIIGAAIVVGIKAVSAIEPIHEAQLLTYLRMGGWRIGLLINFNVPVLKNGIRRRVL